MGKVMQTAGALAWYVHKLEEIKECAEIAYNATDPDRREEALYAAATKLAETVAIGIPLYYVDKLLTKTGLDRVFDSLKKHKNFGEYLKDQIAARQLRDVGLGELAEWGLKELRELISENQLLDPIFDSVNDLFGSARNFFLPPVPVDPLAFDLDGDGIETVGVGSVLFDHNGDGVRTGTGWLKGDDAFLVLDRNGNGVIDNGSELFGDQTVLSNGQRAANGLAALADLDSNQDGVFDSADDAYAHVRLWRDLNQNGSSDDGELMSLAEAGIASINLNGTNTSTNFGNGNAQSAATTYTRADGSTGMAGNLDLATNTFYREFTDRITLTDAAKALPGMVGAGMVRDLREAASLDEQIVSDVNGFSAMSRAEMLSAIDTLIDHWAGTSTMKSSTAAAQEKNYTLGYLVPGMSASDWLNLHADSALVPGAAETARLEALRAQYEPGEGAPKGRERGNHVRCYLLFV